MQVLRKSVGDKLFDLVGNPLELNPPVIKYASAEEIMTIDEGQDIMVGTDISIDPIVAKDIQEALFSIIKIKFT